MNDPRWTNRVDVELTPKGRFLFARFDEFHQNRLSVEDSIAKAERAANERFGAGKRPS